MSATPQPVLDRWALSRALTHLANADPMTLARRPPREPPARTARRIGVTGAPGAGKSTLVGHLALARAPRGRLGVLAVDPSSPKSGGAILGDRVRMDELAGNAQLYIRSLGSRRTGDGLADNLPEMLDLMDDFGFDEVILETVGVGQAEHAVRAQVDTLALVLLPDSGDVVQAMKAGIMEMADIFVVHKSDLPGAQRMASDIRRIAAMARHAPDDWVAPILLSSAAQPASIQALSEAIDRHQTWLANAPHSHSVQRARYRLKRLLELRIAQFMARQKNSFFDAPLARQLAATLDALHPSEGSPC